MILGHPNGSLYVELAMSDQEALEVHHALSVAVQLIEQVHAMPGGIPRDAALQFDARDRLVKVARRLDHERRHKGRVPNPHRPISTPSNQTEHSDG